MNKFVKLPLFLGVCGAICTGVLAVLNFATAGTISNRNEILKNANYLELMEVETADKIEDGTIGADLQSKGITAVKAIYVGKNVLGVVYDGSFNDGFSTWNFQIGIKDGKFTGLKYSSEKPDSIGLPIMAKYAEAIKGKDVSGAVSDYVSSISSTNTVPALNEIVMAVANDYTAIYAK